LFDLAMQIRSHFAAAGLHLFRDSGPKGNEVRAVFASAARSSPVLVENRGDRIRSVALPNADLPVSASYKQTPEGPNIGPRIDWFSRGPVRGSCSSQYENDPALCSV
jgi:hypothetical protein